MPIYAYRCERCAFQQDVLQKMSDPLLVTCPACGEATFRKQVTAAGFQLKGSGWYVTDFRNPAAKDAKNDAATPDGPKKDEASPAETKSGEGAAPANARTSATDAKPAASPAPAPAAPAAPAAGST